VTASTLLVASGAQATLVGATVDGQLEGLGSIRVGTPFVTPATVGAGTEFSGTVEDGTTGPPSGNPLDVSVDFSDVDDTFVIDTFVSGQWGTSGGDGFSVLLTVLAWPGTPGVITEVVLSGRLGNTQKWDLDFADLITYPDPESVLIQLLLLPRQPASGRAAFEFDITTAQVVVPEPASAVLLVFGLVGMGFKRRAAL